MKEWIDAIYAYLGVDHPRLSLIVACIVGALLSGFVWSVVGYQYRKSHLVASNEALVGTTEADPRLPGMAIHMWVRINHLPALRRKYLLDFGKKDRERLSVYVSSDNIFTVSFVDANGEPHPLQIPIGTDGFPLGDFFHLGCEAGISATTTVVRIVVNGKKMREVILPFRANIGALDVDNGVLGADLDGKDGASFDLAELMVFVNTLPAIDEQNLERYFRERIRTKIVQFKGIQWMRVSKAAQAGVPIDKK